MSDRRAYYNALRSAGLTAYEALAATYGPRPLSAARRWAVLKVVDVNVADLARQVDEWQRHGAPLLLITSAASFELIETNKPDPWPNVRTAVTALLAGGRNAGT